jgi:hypothetical protein
LVEFRRLLKTLGRDSSVGIAVGYELDGPGIESRWGRDFPHPSRPALGPTQPPIQLLTSLFPGDKAAGALCCPPTPYCPEVKGRVELYLYYPSGPSWPVIRCSLPLPFTQDLMAHPTHVVYCINVFRECWKFVPPQKGMYFLLTTSYQDEVCWHYTLSCRPTFGMAKRTFLSINLFCFPEFPALSFVPEKGNTDWDCMRWFLCTSRHRRL